MESHDPGRAVEAAGAAFRGPWREVAPAERGRILSRATQIIRDEAERLAMVESLESGNT
jgi:aldehyde dehydrogenase (NAD+)